MRPLVGSATSLIGDGHGDGQKCGDGAAAALGLGTDIANVLTASQPQQKGTEHINIKITRVTLYLGFRGMCVFTVFIIYATV